MAKKPKSVIGLDFGKSVVKMVEYSTAKKHVTTIAKLFLDPSEWSNESKLGEKMQEWIQEKRQSTAAEIVTALPGEGAVIRVVDVPPDESDVKGAVFWDMNQHLAAPVEEYLLDFQNIGSDSGTRNRYLSAAYRTSEVNKIKGLIESTQSPLTVMDIDIFATQNAFEVNYPEYLAQNIMIVKADLHGISCIHTQKGQFLNHKHFPVPDEFATAEDSERAKLTETMAADISRILDEGINGDPLSQNVQKLFFCGDLATDQDFGLALESTLPLALERLNSFKEIKFPHDPEYADKVSETAPQCATALGLALRYGGDC